MGDLTFNDIFRLDTNKIETIYNQQSSFMVKAVQRSLITGTIFVISLGGLSPQKEINSNNTDNVFNYISSNLNYEPIKYTYINGNEVYKNDYLFEKIDFKDEQKVGESNIIKSEVTPLEKEYNTMYQKLIKHRNNVEKWGIFTGTILGTSIFILSFISLIDWKAVLPASILFYSLPVFMIMRRQLRGDGK